MHPILERARILDPLTLRALDVRRLSRELRRSDIPADARIAFAGNIMFEPLPEFLEAHLACHGVAAATHVAPFDQALQSLLDPTSMLRRFDPTFIVLHTQLDALLPGLATGDADEASECSQDCVCEVMKAIEPSVRAAIKATPATVLLTNFPAPKHYELGLADSRAGGGEQEFFAQLNSALRAAFRAEPRVQIVDLQRLVANYGALRARDRRLYYLAKMPWREGFMPVLADELARHINVTLGRLRKCLVVDLDNTLWAGVLGEDGPQGVRVGPGDPEGEAHFDLQRRILAIKRRGVLLAACSKNNPEDVEALFRERPDMPLRRSDFVVIEAGWTMKHEGLMRVAANLNIGSDSLVFLDDNPAEIDLIRQLMPEVQLVQVPTDPAMRPTCLDRVHSLDRAAITVEDRNKTVQYQQNAQRRASQRSAPELNDYLRSLKTRITLREADGEMLPRAHQLFLKTNQFNVTTRRYTLAQLQAFTADPQSQLVMVQAADRFGDLGWIGVVLLHGLGRPETHIDSFALSCRALGRGIETAVLNHLTGRCLSRPACSALTAEFSPTAKNAPARELYSAYGFSPSDAGAGRISYRLAREAHVLSPCDWIAVTDERPAPARSTPGRTSDVDRSSQVGPGRR